MDKEEAQNNLKLLQEKWQHDHNQQSIRNAPSMFQGDENENLIKWQLDVKEELMRIEHLLRKHVPKTDEKGNIFYEEPKEEDKLFNETGVTEILNLLAWYLNKNIFLSNYTEKQINLRCKQFARRLARFIYCNYQRFGWTTKDKMKHFEMVVMNVVDVVESAYNRALNGGERNSLRTARHVLQNEPINQGYPPMQQKRSFSLMKPTTWMQK